MAKSFTCPSSLHIPTSSLEAYSNRKSHALLNLLSDDSPHRHLRFSNRWEEGPVRRVISSSSAPSVRRRWRGASSAISINHHDTTQFEEATMSTEFEDDSDVLIECRNIHKSFGEKHVLRGVSFKIRQGEAVGIIGPSGTGKSTILKIMAGLLAPDKGELYIRGKKRHGLISDEEISGLRIGLGVEDRLPSELSGGMKKRVALARAIIFDDSHKAIEPEVVMYDEPTAGLDPIASTVVEDLIRAMHIKGHDAVGRPGKITSYIVVTHQHSTIRRAVDRGLPGCSSFMKVRWFGRV